LAFPLIFLVIGSCVSAPKGAIEESGEKVALGPNTAPLSYVLRERLTGLDLDDPADLVALKAQVDTYLKNKDCTGTNADHVICQTLDAQAQRRSTARALARSKKGQGKGEERKIARAILEGDQSGLSSATESMLIRALKRVPQSKDLSPFARKLLEATECPDPSILAVLGMRLEQAFPDVDAQALATGLLQRAVDCGDGSSSVRAAYRLGLIRVWQQDFASAEKLLAKIINHPASADYRLRALYWLNHAAKAQKNETLAKETRETIQKDFPLSLHALLVGPSGSYLQPALTSSHDPQVAFRSKQNPLLNRIFSTSELLLDRGEEHLASQVLDNHFELIRGAETSVQLYGATLLFRAGHTLKKFQLVASLLREDSNAVAKPSLELLYPLRRFELVRDYEHKIDPYLILALIRQESAFNENARSRVGAVGLMQLMPRTARRMERVSKVALFRPEVNIRLGVRYFSGLLDRYSGDVELALAAYNAGPERVDEWMKRYPVSDRVLFLDLIPFRETREYVASIARNYYWYLSLYNSASLGAQLDKRQPASLVDASDAPVRTHQLPVFQALRLETE
jgi:soluble lytic murein transglycosylase-like protein